MLLPGTYAQIIGPQWNRFNHVMRPGGSRTIARMLNFGMGDAWLEYMGEIHKIVWRDEEVYWGQKVIVVGFKGIPYRWAEWMIEPCDKLQVTWEV